MVDTSHLAVSLDAVIVAVTNDVPRVLVVERPDELPAIPSGRLDAANDDTLAVGLRRLVREQTGLELGYMEQLYTFGDKGRRPGSTAGRELSVGYLALIHESPPAPGARWVDFYELLPWEDQRGGSPAVVADSLEPVLERWATGSPEASDRYRLMFGDPWDGTRVLERYELLYEAGLVPERARDASEKATVGVGLTMRFDHRRIAATALGRIRGKLTYRPVVFELLPDRFTLLDLQRTVEALAGVRVHKQNFRRLVERSGLVEGTGERSDAGSGRPAELFRYRPEVVLERSRPGIGQPYA